MNPDSVRARLRGVAERVPAGARRRAGRLVRRVRAGRPEVAAIVLLHGPEDQARRTVDAVRDQRVARLQIVLVVLDERLTALAAEAAQQDWRVRRVAAPGADVAPARRLGSAAAPRDWLLFVSPGQLLLPGAVAALLAARPEEPTVVLGALQDGPAGGWARSPLLARLLVPRERWARVVDDSEPDGQTSAVTLLCEGHVEAGTATLRDAGARRARLFERVENPMGALSGRVGQDRDMLATLDRPSTAGHRAERAAGALTRDLPRFLLGVEWCDEDQWQLLHTHAAELLEVAGEARAGTVPVEDRVAAWLAGQGRREELTTFVAQRRFAGGHHPTEVVDASVLARFDVAQDVPTWVLRLTADESALRAQVRRTRVLGDDLVVELFVGLRRVDQDDPQVAVRLLGQEATLSPAVTLTEDAGVTRWMGEPHQRHHRGVVELRVPLAEVTPGVWRVEVEVTDRGVRRSGLVAELDGTGSAAHHFSGDGVALRWDPVPAGVALRVGGAPPPRPTGAVVTGAEVATGELRLRLDAPAGCTVALLATGQRVEGREDGQEWVFALETDPWGLGPTDAPTGGYRLRVDHDGAELPVALADEVAARLPLFALDDRHRTALWRGPHGGLVLRLDPPLGEDEAGPWAQRRLQQDYLAVSEPLDPRLVYFQCFLGQDPSDHPGAIQAELRRALDTAGRRDVRVRWAVADSSVRVPEGAEAVLLRSREWYDVLARAAWVVTCIELDPWFTRREGQEVLETYHGYPAKAMGLGQWRARGLTPTHLDQMLARTSGSWNNLLTPIPEMDRHYRENYDFGGRIIHQGYPRDDALVAAGHAERRARTRERLGIGPAQRAVLYAPTWRDDLATNFRSAQAVLHLDVARAAHELGPDHVVLLRGHRFHTPSAGGARVVDVTTYPDVNDLILASDAAVLDYSSMRFDFAITGRPMVFLVPDLHDYTERQRGFLFDFATSAPGPLVETTDEVVAALADLPALTRAWAGRIAEFNDYYNRLADGQAAQRVVAEFFAPLLAGSPAADG